MSRIKLDSIKKTREVPISRCISLTVEQWLCVIHAIKTYRGGRSVKSHLQDEVRKTDGLIQQIYERLIEEDNRDGL